MKQALFYAQLFSSVSERIGPIDDTDIIPFVGFDRGGMIRLSTVGRETEEFAAYITCELATMKEQLLARFGNYEVMMSCDDTAWARTVLSELGRMSLRTAFEHGHALDIGDTFGPDFPLQGLIVEEFVRTQIDGRPYGIHRIHGVTRPELEFAIRFGANALIDELKHAGVYPLTSIHRLWSVAGESRSIRQPAARIARPRLVTAISSS